MSLLLLRVPPASALLFQCAAAPCGHFVQLEAGLLAPGFAFGFPAPAMNTGWLNATLVADSLTGNHTRVLPTGEVFSMVAAATGTATPGALSGSAEVAALREEGTVHAKLYLQFGDTLTITSATLPPGTPVEFLADVDLNSIVMPALGQSRVWAEAYAELAVNPSSWPGVTHVPGTTSARFCAGNASGTGVIDITGTFNCSGPGGQKVSAPPHQEVVVETHVGDEFAIVGYLLLRANTATWSGEETWVTAAAVAIHTADFHIQPLTPDVSYTTSSGLSYLPTAGPGPEVPVPGPGTLLLLGAGLLGLGAVALTSRRKSLQASVGRGASRSE